MLTNNFLSDKKTYVEKTNCDKKSNEIIFCDKKKCVTKKVMKKKTRYI